MTSLPEMMLILQTHEPSNFEGQYLTVIFALPSRTRKSDYNERESHTIFISMISYDC